MYQTNDHSVAAGAMTPALVSSTPASPVTETRVLALLPEKPRALGLVRWAEQLARVTGGTFWCAHLAPSREGTEHDSSRDIRAAFRLADELGGRSVELHADVLFDDLFQFIAQQRITHIVVGKPRGVPLGPFLAATLPREFTDDDGGPRIVVVAEAASDPR